MEKKKQITGIISGAIFLIGFFFINQSKSVTGNVILNNRPLVEPTSIIGLILIVCSVVLAFYTLRQK